MKLQYQSPEFKETLKLSLEELFSARPDILEPVLMEVVEDLCMANAIKQSKKAGLANKKQVEAFMNENRV